MTFSLLLFRVSDTVLHMTDDDNTPATKADLNKLREELTAELREEMDRRFDEQRKLINQDFVDAMRVNNEQLVHDFAGIFNDRTQQHSDKLDDHETRISRVDADLGLVV
ncbi:MAG: hypothetical protein H8E66_21010 [Planctomycetes bacterium]|nr:hypothetical protein [Planctomycetota bacterium]